MRRRSTRLSLQIQKNYAEESGDEVAEVPETMSRKRKSTQDGDKNFDELPRELKRSRRSKRGLEDFIYMPLDVVYEIFGFLQPIDLLQLARATKSLRKMLMSRSSASIWRIARSNILDLPDCPEDLSEPQYAHFLFGPGCNFCGRKVQGIEFLWTARMRSCKRCLLPMIEEKDPEWCEAYAAYPYLSEVFQVSPGICSPERSGNRYFAFIELERQWKEEYMKASDKAQWAIAMIERREKINKHAKACEDWYANKLEIDKAARASLIESRKANVVQRIKDLGWEDELSKLAEDDERQKVILPLCEQELKAKSLRSLDRSINEFMGMMRSIRLTRERRAIFRARIPMLSLALLNFNSLHFDLKPDAMYPGVCDVFQYPQVKAIIEGTSAIRAESLNQHDIYTPLLSEITLPWQKDIRSKLVDMIRRALPEYDFNEETVLDLATTSFHCHRSSLGPLQRCSYSDYMRFPRVVMHRCATHDEDRFNDFEYGSDEHLLREVVKEVTWNRRRNIRFNPDNMKVLSDIVKKCGLDPKVTTAVQMNELDPIFECEACNDENSGRATMKWWGLLVHYIRHHRASGGMKLITKLEEHEAIVVRARMVEQEERHLSGQNVRDLICNHCYRGWHQNLPDVMHHLKACHHIPNPTMKDVQHRCNTYYPPELFRLWPPRSTYVSSEAVPVVAPVVVKNEDISPD